MTKNVTINQAAPVTPAAPIATAPKPNYMDMNKLSQASSYKPSTSLSSSRSSSMNMSALSRSSSSFSSSSRRK